MSDANDWNAQIIDEFRANAGNVGGQFEGAPLMLLHHPEATIEVGTETKTVWARVADDDERGPIWETQKERFPGFAEYETQTSRQIPVVILEPVA